MKTMSEFWAQLRIMVKDSPDTLKILEELEDSYGTESWNRLCLNDVSLSKLLGLRHTISLMFRQKLMKICTGVIFDSIVRYHANTIIKFDELAWNNGFQITEKRECITSIEIMEEVGTAKMTGNGAVLTSNGHKIAEHLAGVLNDVNNEIPPSEN